jgi:hydroxymethylbilane synthase
MTKRHVVIATRESPLAIKQAESVKALLLNYHPLLSIELLQLTTQGDRQLDTPLTEIGGKGLFVKELEEALLDGRADIAVHSMKDVPMTLPPGLFLPVIVEREDVRDAFLSNQYTSLAQLPSGASIGTASLRRQTQLRAIRSDVDMQDLRGNIHTRLRRLDDGDFTAIILAAAGLKRMHLVSRVRSYFSIEQCMPAAGQGALGIECLVDNEAIRDLIAPLNHAITYICVSTERALCRKLGGNCKLPVAAYAQIHHGKLTLQGLVASADGTRILRVKRDGVPKDAESIGVRCADELLQQGADKILAEYE